MAGSRGADSPLCRSASCGGPAPRHHAAQDHHAVQRMGLGEDGGGVIPSFEGKAPSSNFYQEAMILFLRNRRKWYLS